MKQSLANLWTLLSQSSAATRLAIAAGVFLAIVVAGASMYRSANPHMEFFVGDLDNASFARATKALSQSGVRFETSVGAPYTIWVESGRKYDAHNAIAQAGALDAGTLGIDTSDGSNPWASSIERKQVADARYWQEVERQLNQLHWVRASKVLAKMPTNRVLGRAPHPTVSVMLTTNGMRPTPEQGLNVGNIVRAAFNVPEENITILDQNGHMIFDGQRDDRLDESLAYERNFNDDLTRTVQTLLDDIYGPNLTRVAVRGEWSFVKSETVGNNLQPDKRLISKSTMKSSQPSPVMEGGPAGLEESFLGPTAASGPVQSDPATKTEIDENYNYGTQTTHVVEDTPVLKRLSVSLALDASLQEQASAIADQVKAAVGFSEQRGDFLAAHTTALNGVERDEEGNIVAPAPIEAAPAPNPMMGLLVERGIELAALLIFMFLLARSFKVSKKQLQTAGSPSFSGAPGGIPGAAGKGVDPEMEEDPSAMARMHVEKLLETDPDRVSSLLTRWAMGEDFYAKNQS